MNKIILTCILLIAFHFGFWNKIYMPDEYEAPIAYRIITIFLYMGGYFVSVVNKLTNIPSPYLMRLFTNYWSFTSPFIEKNNYIVVHDFTVLNTPIKVYSSRDENKISPVIFFIHGGAFVTFNIDFYNTYLYELATQTNFTIVAMEYSLAPEYPFPHQIDECQKVIEHMVKHKREYKIDSNRIILMGDSSGGHTVAVLSQRFALQNSSLIKLQILLSPFLLLHNFHHPSAFEYQNNTYFNSIGLHHGKVLLWYLGITEYTSEMYEEIASESLIYSIEDVNVRKKYIERLSFNLIPKEFTQAKPYYKKYELKSMNVFDLNYKLNENHIFKRDERFAKLAEQILSNDMSPSLVDDELLKHLPRTYIVVCEWDPLKDQELIYAQRLRLNGIQVEIAYYDKTLHGTHFLGFLKFESSIRVMNDIVNYLNNENI